MSKIDEQSPKFVYPKINHKMKPSKTLLFGPEEKEKDFKDKLIVHLHNTKKPVPKNILLKTDFINISTTQISE